MQATALRMLPARQCRLAAAAVQQRQRSVPPRVVRVHASAEVEMDNMGYKAVEELQQLERSGTLDFPSLDSLRYLVSPAPCCSSRSLSKGPCYTIATAGSCYW